MVNEKRLTLALFYCQNVPGSDEQERQRLEETYGTCLRLFPIPCSGRLESVHLLRALEEFADAAYVVTCPKGSCRYFEGNAWAGKRVERAKDLIARIGLEPERLGIRIGSGNGSHSLAQWSEEIFKDISGLDPSPVFKKGPRSN